MADLRQPLYDPATHAGKLFVGQWIDADERRTVREPATGAAIRGRAAQQARVTVPPERKRTLFLAADAAAKRHADEWLGWLMREVGATRNTARFEFAFAFDEILEAASYPTQHTLRDVRPGRAVERTVIALAYRF
jgi:acyl-CoA reductase-like NAD-dependent aldehyde dehydrogenase